MDDDDPGYVNGRQYVHEGRIYRVIDVWVSIVDGEPTGRHVIVVPLGRRCPRQVVPADRLADILRHDPDEPA